MSRRPSVASSRCSRESEWPRESRRADGDRLRDPRLGGRGGDPSASELEHADAFPETLVEQMKELGLFGVIIPEEYGGLGLDRQRTC